MGGYGIASLVFLVHGMLPDPEMLKERSHKANNVKPWDAQIFNIYTTFFVIIIILAPINCGRFHWSKVPFGVNLLGLVLMVLSFALLLWVTTTNTYLSR
jgi:protein-S-isoprenylcysteine O-methyltransferase Ste14